MWMIFNCIAHVDDPAELSEACGDCRGAEWLQLL